MPDTSSTTGGEGGHVVIVRDAKSLAHWIKKGKKKKPLIVKVDGMIDVSSLRNAKNETMQMLSASSYVSIVGMGKNSGIISGGIKISGFDICKEGSSGDCLEKDSIDPPPGIEPENNVIIRNMVFRDCAQDCISVNRFLLITYGSTIATLAAPLTELST